MASRAASDTSQHGKQIVFLFMAATVVSVVVFICGVLVGRGTPAHDGATPPPDTFAIYELPPATLTTPSAKPSAGAEVSHDLTYPQRLLGSFSTSAAVSASSPESAGGASTSTSSTPTVARPTDAAGSRSEADSDFSVGAPLDRDPGIAAPSAPAEGYAVQVSASRGASSAEAVALQLRSKGFPAFVLDPFPDDPGQFYRVRVGPYSTRAEADHAREQLTDREGMSAAYVTR